LCGVRHCATKIERSSRKDLDSEFSTGQNFCVLFGNFCGLFGEYVMEASKAADFRMWAAQCTANAEAAATPADRERLIKMRDALLALADNEDWLHGSVARSERQEEDELVALAERIVGFKRKTRKTFST